MSAAATTAPSLFLAEEAALTDTLGIIMGGGAGLGLFPLTKDRAKPAVPLAGKYRLVDIPISNCINSGVRQVFVLTQYNSAPLNRHISRSYNFDAFSGDFIEVLAAQQTPDTKDWYQGTADAVRQNLRYFTDDSHKYFLIVSGDHLYRMDFRKLVECHVANGADITIATTPVCAGRVKGLGIMQADETGRISKFVEKPEDVAVLPSLAMSKAAVLRQGLDPKVTFYQGNMGIYVFNREVLIEALNNQFEDFGRHVIPAAMAKYHVHSYPFQGYWENIGNIGSFFEANLDLCAVVPKYNFFDSQSPIFTHPRFLPATKINGGEVQQALVSDGCIITAAVIHNSILGLRTIVEQGTTIKDSVILGANYYGGGATTSASPAVPGIGKNCWIERAIIDKNVSIGDNVIIRRRTADENMDDPGGLFYVRDGIVVIPKDTVIPSGTQI